MYVIMFIKGTYTIGNYLKQLLGVKTYFVTNNGELLVVNNIVRNGSNNSLKY